MLARPPGTLRGMTDQQNTPIPNPEADEATPEARALHGDKARAETHEQPEAIVLDGDTRIAQPETGESARR